jgi:hypothetical protein
MAAIRAPSTPGNGELPLRVEGGHRWTLQAGTNGSGKHFAAGGITGYAVFREKGVAVEFARRGGRFMPFSTFRLSVATAGMATVAFAIAAPASAQEYSAHKHYAHTHYAHARYRHYAHHGESRQIVVHPQPALAQNSYRWGPVGAAGSVVGGTGQAVQAVFYGAGGIVGGVLGGVFGGASALFGGPGYSYAPANGYGGPFAAPFNAAGSVAATPFQFVSGAFVGTPPAAAY